MNKQEAERLQLALDGISANLETIRSLISGMVIEQPIEQWQPASTECRHATIREINTMGEAMRFCDDCGYEL